MQQVITLFLNGGPIMWPILILSLFAFTVVIERFIFLYKVRHFSDTNIRSQIIRLAGDGQFDKAIQLGKESSDFVARTLAYALNHREEGLTEALMHASNHELLRFRRGLPVLDTAITLAPLLGLLGTVTGMITAFGMVTGELGAPSAITGGIAEALLATAFGLGVAIISLIPFNTLNAKCERAQHELEDSGTLLELAVAKQNISL